MLTYESCGVPPLSGPVLPFETVNTVSVKVGAWPGGESGILCQSFCFCCDRVGCRPCPSSILGGPRVLRLRDDCSEIMDCDGITMIALGGISLGLVVGWVEEMAG